MASLIGQLLVELGINTGAFKDGLDKATYSAKQFGSQLKGSFSDLGNSITKLGGQFAGLGQYSAVVETLSASFKTLNLASVGAGEGLAPLLAAGGAGLAALGAGALAATAGVSALAVEGAKTVEELSLISAKTGITIQDLQTLKAAGESVNVPLEALVTGFRKFEQALADTGKGSAAQQAVLKSLGVTAHEPMAAMLQVADAFKNIQDPAVKASDAIILFGKSGLNLIPFLDKGKAGVEEFSKIVDQYGTHIGGSAVKSTEAWKTSVVELSTAWDGFKVAAIGALPIVASVTELAAKATSAFGRAIGDAVAGSKAMLSLATTGSVGANANADTSGADTAQAKAAEARQAASDKLLATQRAYFEQVQAGGQAAYALEKARQEVAEFTAADNYKAAAAIQAQIPALEQAAKIEKERRDAIFNLPKNTASNIDEQQVAVTKAYADALRGQTAASVEAAAAQDALAITEKFAKDNQLIASTTQFKDALAKVGAQALETSRFIEAFKQVTTDNKGLDEFIQKTNTQISDLAKEADAIGKVGDANAKSKAALEKYNAELAVATGVFDRMVARYGVANPLVQEQGQLLTILAAKVNQASAALDKLAAQQTATGFAKSLAEIKEQTSALNEMNAVLLKDGPIAAQAAEQANKLAVAYGLDATQTKALTAALQAQLTVRDQLTAANQKAASATYGAQNQIAEYQQEIAALKQIEAANAGNAQVVQLSHLALAQVNADLQDARAKTGSFADGIRAGFASFNASTESFGQTLEKVTSTALNGFTQNFASMVATGKADWKGLVDTMEEDLLKSSLETIMKRLFGALSNAFGGNSTLLGGIFSGFGGGKAGGGDLTPGKTYLTGEHGPELIRTGAAGASIVPAGQFGGGGGQNISQSINISTPNLDGFNRSQGQIKARMQRLASQSYAHLT